MKCGSQACTTCGTAFRSGSFDGEQRCTTCFSAEMKSITLPAVQLGEDELLHITRFVSARERVSNLRLHGIALIHLLAMFARSASITY